MNIPDKLIELYRSDPIVHAHLDMMIRHDVPLEQVLIELVIWLVSIKDKQQIEITTLLNNSPQHPIIFRKPEGNG